MSNRTYATPLAILVVLVWATTSFPQGYSKGTIDFTFCLSQGAQVAIWAEDENGEYLKTVYVTNKVGRRGLGNRTSSPDIDISGGSDGNRLSALPIWTHKRGVIDTTFGIENYYPPAETQPSYPDDIDAISGATPSADVTQTKTWQLSDLPYGEYSCWIEVNRSYDKNDYHNYSWYRGQPSVVWNVTVVVGDSADSSAVLDYGGYGSPDGSDGAINPPDSTITTAFNLLKDLGGYRFKSVHTPLQPVEVDTLTITTPDSTYIFGLMGVSMNFTSVGTSGDVIVSRFDNNPPNPGGKTIARYYEIDSAMSGFAVDLTFSYAQSEFDASGLSSEDILYLAHSTDNGATWHPIASTPDADANTVTAFGVDHFSIFGIGGEGAVELLSFTAQAGDAEVTLLWVTESEVNNLGFHVWRSLEQNGTYERLTTELIPGAGTSASGRDYSYTDVTPINGVTYWYKVEDVGSEGKGRMHGPVAATPRADVGVEEIEEPLPDTYDLSINYPNPFNPQTVIEYRLPEEIRVSLRVYDIAGRVVEVLEEGGKKAGWHKVLWDGLDTEGREVASGFYLYRLRAGDFVKVRKMALVR